jgi:5-bromo-4-chloroindolyl phosphate hydrolysis protein
MKKNNWTQFVLPLLISSAVFFLSIAALKWNIAIASALSVCLYIGLSFLSIPVFRLRGADGRLIKNAEGIISLLEEGERNLLSVKAIIDQSKDSQIKEKAQTVYAEGGKIIGYIRKNPHKAAIARRFFNYYLSKANEILTKYKDISSVEIETERLTALRAKTEIALETISKGMVLQFSRLISSEVIDIEADINLLESTIKMEDAP